MARVKSSGLTRAGLGRLSGTLLAYDALQEDDKQGTWQGLAGFSGFGDATVARPSITGITGVDDMLYGVEDQLATFKLAMTITTISSLAAAIAGVLLILDSRK